MKGKKIEVSSASHVPRLVAGLFEWKQACVLARETDWYVIVEQLCFLHPSTHKLEHPRFCYERLEYLGSKVQVPQPFLPYLFKALILLGYRKPVLKFFLKYL